MDFLRPLSWTGRWPPSPGSPRCPLCESVSRLPLSRGPQTHWLGAPPTTSLSLNYPFKDPISRGSYILRSWELGPPHTNLGEPEPPSQNKPDPQARAVLAEYSREGGAVSSPLWEVHCGLGGVLPTQGWWSRPAQTVQDENVNCRKAGGQWN